MKPSGGPEGHTSLPIKVLSIETNDCARVEQCSTVSSAGRASVAAEALADVLEEA